MTRTKSEGAGARLTSQLVRAYRRAFVEVFEDDPVDSSESLSVVVDMIQRIKQCTSGTEQLIHEFERGQITLSALTDILSYYLPFDTEIKLQLLAEANPIARSEVIRDHLPKPQEPETPGRDFPPKFSGN